MNKKLLAVVVGAALSAGATVTAQADTTVYGHFHVSWDRIDNSGGNKHSFIADNSSRFGIKGSEDLGGGMKAIYQVESGSFNTDEGNGGFGATLRNTFIGLSGAWGSVKVGRHDTPTKSLHRKVDDFNEQIGDARSIIGSKGAFDPRVSNMVLYESPKIAGGLTFAALQTSNNGDEAAVNSAEKVTSASVIWSDKAIFAGVAYSSHGNSTGTEDPSIIRGVFKYDFGAGDVGGMYETMSDLNGVSGRDQNTYGVFGSFRITKATAVKAHFYKADDIDTLPNTGGKLAAIGVDHKLGKKTTVYANYAKASNDAAATYSVTSSTSGHGDTLPAPSAGNDAKGVTVGMIIKF